MKPNRRNRAAPAPLTHLPPPPPPEEELVLRETDVLCGRESGLTAWTGNVEFRYLCWKLKPLYEATSRLDKTPFAEAILAEIAALEPSGRFVELVEGTTLREGRCVAAPASRAIEKVRQALREKKNACPRQYKHAERGVSPPEPKNKRRRSIVAGMRPKFTQERIGQLKKEFAAKFVSVTSVTFEEEKADITTETVSNVATGEKTAALATASAASKPENKNQKKAQAAKQEDGEVKKDSAGAHAARMTARQAVLESIQQVSKKRTITDPERISPPNKKRRTATPKITTPRKKSRTTTLETTTPRKSQKALSKRTVTPEKELIQRRSSADSNKPTAKFTENKQPTLNRIKNVAVMAPKLHTSPSHFDKEMALLPPTLTALCSGIYTNMMANAAAANLMEPGKHRSTLSTTSKSQNPTSLDFSTVQPIALDESELLELNTTPLRSWISTDYTYSKDLTIANNKASEERIPMTSLATYLSDFFDKKYFPILTSPKTLGTVEGAAATLKTGDRKWKTSNEAPSQSLQLAGPSVQPYRFHRLQHSTVHHSTAARPSRRSLLEDDGPLEDTKLPTSILYPGTFLR